MLLQDLTLKASQPGRRQPVFHLEPLFRARAATWNRKPLWPMESSRFRRRALPSAGTVPAGEGSSWRSRFRNRSRNHKKPFRSSWDQFHRDARALAWRLAGAGPFEAIVCVTRGGLVPAAIVARELGIRLIETVCVASYDHVTQGELKVLKDVAAASWRSAAAAARAC